MAREMKDSGIEWIGVIPRNWKLAQLKRFASICNGREILDEIDKSKDAIPVYGSGGVFKYTNVHLYDGETVMFGRKGTLGKPVYANGKLWTVDTMYYLTFSKALSAKYCYYQFVIFDWQPHITRTALPSIVGSEIVSSSFVFPPLNEQQRIASFLDAECARIDSVIEQTRASIEEYKKLKQAVITRAVTKGIRPDCAMKDSEVEWIGDVPLTWSVSKLGNVLRLRNERNYKPLEEVNLISLYTDKGVVQHSDLEKTSGNIAQNANGYKIVHKNDIVVNIILAWMGAMGISKFDGVTSPAYDVYEINTHKIEPHYCHYILRTPAMASECYKYGRGIMMMRWRTYSPEFKKIKMPLPPLHEQEKIADYLDAKCAEIDALIDQKREQIAVLNDYKKSVIYEYVTGKKEVPAR